MPPAHLSGLLCGTEYCIHTDYSVNCRTVNGLVFFLPLVDSAEGISPNCLKLKKLKWGKNPFVAKNTLTTSACREKWNFSNGARLASSSKDGLH